MIHDIVTSEGDVDHYVKAYINVYIVLKPCVDVGQWKRNLGCLVFGVSIGKHPILYRKP